MTAEKLVQSSKDQLNLVLSFFPRVETKLSVLLAINTGMLAVLGTNAPPLSAFSLLMKVITATTLLLLAASIVMLYLGAFPSLKGGHDSLVYFREIAKRTEHRFVEEFRAQTEERLSADLLGQVWRNSEILRKKYDCLKGAFTLIALAIPLWAVSVLLFAAYNSQARSIFLK
jgi:hypothetical protein